MYTITCFYFDGTYREYHNISEVYYYNSVGDELVSSNEILKHRFPLDCDLYLYSENSSYIVSSKDLKEIAIEIR